MHSLRQRALAGRHDKRDADRVAPADPDPDPIAAAHPNPTASHINAKLKPLGRLRRHLRLPPQQVLCERPDPWAGRAESPPGKRLTARVRARDYDRQWERGLAGRTPPG